MSPRDVSDILAERAHAAGLEVPDQLSAQLAAYYRLLSHWNRKMNLTSLSDVNEAVDRLLLEPVAAAPYLPGGADLIDLGSGGGSPAVPLALATGASRLVMVESRARKAAFLREVLRELAIPGGVETVRFEELGVRPQFAEAFGLASVRAVRLDASVFETLSALLHPNAQAALFRTVESEDPPVGLPPSLQWTRTARLLTTSRSALTVLTRVG